MKVAISILLSVSLLLQALQFQVSDLWGLGELVEHVEMHSEKYGDSFSDFLTKHYGSLKKEHYEHHSEHDELPFNQNSPSAGVGVFVLDHQELPALRLPGIGSLRGTFFYSDTYSSYELEDIFQPPRAA